MKRQGKAWYKTILAPALAALLITAGLLLRPGAARAVVYTSSPAADCEKSLRDYPQFALAGETGCLIPGLREGLVPQGIAFLPEKDLLFFVGYREDGGPSAVVAADRSTGEIALQAELYNTDGTPYTGHAGGVCVTEKDLYVSNNHRLYRLPLAGLFAPKEAGRCAFASEIPVPVNSSFCFYGDGVLWVGEFEHGDAYHTDSSHRVRTRDGDFRAWICGYRLAREKTLPDGAQPDMILAVSDRIQGVALQDGLVYLSRSYGRKNSSAILRCAWREDEPADETVSLNGRDVPVWYLDSSRRQASLIAPPMTECLCAADGDIYVLFESAAEMYTRPANPSRSPMDRVFILKDF